MNDKSIMPFGEHKGKELANVPDDYLRWFWGENKHEFINSSDRMNQDKFDFMVYIKDSLENLT